MASWYIFAKLILNIITDGDSSLHCQPCHTYTHKNLCYWTSRSSSRENLVVKSLPGTSSGIIIIITIIITTPGCEKSSWHKLWKSLKSEVGEEGHVRQVVLVPWQNKQNQQNFSCTLDKNYFYQWSGSRRSLSFSGFSSYGWKKYILLSSILLKFMSTELAKNMFDC